MAKRPPGGFCTTSHGEHAGAISLGHAVRRHRLLALYTFAGQARPGEVLLI